MAHLDHRHRLDLETSLDFINTLEHSEGGDREDLPSYGAALDWLVGHAAMHDDVARTEAVRTDSGSRIATVRRMRAALREIVDAAVAERPPRASALTAVNRAFAAERATELVARSDGVAVAHSHGRDPLIDALARLAEPIADTLAEGRPDRLRVCSNDSCRWVFYDTSPTGRRRWCDMATCGNRAKAARHRARRRVASG